MSSPRQEAHGIHPTHPEIDYRTEWIGDCDGHEAWIVHSMHPLYCGCGEGNGEWDDSLGWWWGRDAFDAMTRAIRFDATGVYENFPGAPE